MPDPPHECVVVRLIDVSAGKIRLHRNRAHVLDRHEGFIHSLHEKTVFVDPASIDLRETLSHRLDVADARELLPQGGVEAEGCRRFARILLRGCNENARRDRVQNLNPRLRLEDKVCGIRWLAERLSRPC